jgi:lysophospholipase L1-like esterase
MDSEFKIWEKGSRMITRRKRIAFTLIASAIPLSLMIMGFEISLRLKQSKAISSESRRILDQKLGWVPRPGLVREGESLDAINETSHFRMTQDSHGFRRWGDISTKKTRVFVIGDSYTQADDIDDAKTYYSLLADRLPEAEVWAFGCSGYGTFQQSMILEKYAPEIRPDLLLIQLSSNDLINNLMELEDAMPFLSTPGPRPYLMDDGAVKNHFATRNRGLRKFSYTYASISDRLENLIYQSEQWVPGQSRNYGAHRNPENIDKLLQDSISKTALILERMKQIVGPQTQVMAFYDEDVPPLTEGLKDACKKADVPLIGTIGQKMVEEEGRRGQYFYRTRDLWHWNNDGHKLVADLLETPLRQALQPQNSGRDPIPNDKNQPAIARDLKAGDQPR